jgi:hypothetical protein
LAIAALAAQGQTGNTAPVAAWRAQRWNPGRDRCKVDIDRRSGKIWARVQRA